MEHILDGPTPLQQINRLKTVPMGLYAAYHSVIARINQKDFAMRIISWIYYSRRILQMDELLEALVVEEYSQNASGDEELDAILEYMGTPTEIVDACKGLVLYEELSGSVRFSHETIKGFIKSDLEAKLVAQTSLAKTCLTYLGSKVFDVPCTDRTIFKGRITTYKFSRYASQYWTDHIRGDEEEILQDMVVDTFGLIGRRESMGQIKIYSESSWGQFIRSTGWSLLHVVAASGFVTICRRVLYGNDHMYIVSSVVVN